MKLRKPVRLTHQLKCNRADRTSIYSGLNPPIYLGLYGGAASRPQRVKSGRPLYGSGGKVKDATGRLKQSTRRFPFLA